MSTLRKNILQHKALLCQRFCLTLALVVSHSYSLQAQNLVSNGDFEGLMTCPSYPGAIGFDTSFTSFVSVTQWVRPTYGTPDYFHRCAPPATGISVPSNFMGWQEPHSGNAYVGFYTYTNTPYREFITTKLSDTLVKNKVYCLRFFVSTADGVPSSTKTWFAVNEVGACFTDTVPNRNSGAILLPLPYHIRNDSTGSIMDTSAWQEIHGFYTAAGGEKWLTIGTFHHGTVPPYSVLHGTSQTVFSGYLYVDDVSLVPATFIDTTYSLVLCSSTMLLSSADSTGPWVWSTGDTSRSISIQQKGSYTCSVAGDCSRIKETFLVKDRERRIDSFHYVYLCDTLLDRTIISSSLSHGPYSWTTGDTTRSITVTQSAGYRCIVPGDCGDIHSDSFQLALPQIAGSKHSFRNCESAVIDTIIRSSILAGTYLWNTGATSPFIHVSSNGQYTCIAHSACNYALDTFIVEAFDAATPRTYDTSICQGSPPPVLLPASPGLLWYTQLNGPGNSIQPAIATSALGTTILYVDKRAGPCRSNTARITVHVVGQPFPFITDTIYHCPDLAPSDRYIGGIVQDFMQYTWNTGDTGGLLKPPLDGDYIRYGKNACGATSDTFRVRSAACDNCVVFPSAFSPNNDHRNDAFKAFIRCPLSAFDLQIYNRWGERVFVTHNDEGYWDGTKNGTEQPVGTYMFMVSYTNAINGRKTFLKGELLLLR